MMEKILITYGDERFKISKRRLLLEAKDLGIFDKIIEYGPDDLPLCIKSSPLMSYNQGGGYWCWKPYLIWQTLQENKNSIVVYVDAGCRLQRSTQWEYWFNLMKDTDTLVMAYRAGFDYGWKEYFGKTSVNIGNWTKNETRQYFDNILGTDKWQYYHKIWAGAIFARNNSIIIQNWLNVTMIHPELVVDPLSIESQPADYILHRHDQCILTPIVYHYRDMSNVVMIIPETAESDSLSGIIASRIHDIPTPKVTFKTRLIHFIKWCIGERLYQLFHIFIYKR